MTTITFDTLTFVRTLKEAGIPERQAEAISETFRVAQVKIEPVVKPDLRELEMRLKAHIRESKLKLEAKLAETRADLTRWVNSHRRRVAEGGEPDLIEPATL
ncbi:MAG: hypothetical protein ACUVQI_03810 [Thermochromatium sp.]